MNQYKLTFTVTIEGLDDPVARRRAKDIMAAVGEVIPGAEVKLQQVHQDRPPRGVKLGQGVGDALSLHLVCCHY